MHISRVQLANYRNFRHSTFAFRKGVNTLIGENGAGKTNLFRAIRLLLDDSMPRSVVKLDHADFYRGLNDWRGHWIIISLEFDDVSQDEAIQSLFLHSSGNIQNGAVTKATFNLIFRPKVSIRKRLADLAAGDSVGLAALRGQITLADYETVFTGKSTADFANADTYTTIVGNFSSVQFPTELDPSVIGVRLPRIFNITKEVSFTFIQALRDVVSDFRNNRINPLLTLLKTRSGKLDPAAFEPISSGITDVNSGIEALDDVQRIKTDIRETIRGAAGDAYSPSRLSIRSGLSNKPDELFQALRLYVGEDDFDFEGPVTDLSLGGANLIFLTLKLLEYKYQKTEASFANFLLVEEPEAHIHAHIQKTLFYRLDFPDTQVIYSTHSPNISEASKIESVNILGRVEGRCEVFQPANGLSGAQVDTVQRYLDAVRSNLLFAKSVILVEGDAEEILIPTMVRKTLGLSLDELGISLINIRSTGFENISVLFHSDRIRKHCAIITDLDAPLIDTTENADDSETVAFKKRRARHAAELGASRRSRLQQLAQQNRWIRPHFADYTFEVDLLLAGNREMAISALDSLYWVWLRS